MDKLRMESPDLVQGNVEKIAALFPNCVTEGPDGHGGLKRAIDFDKLRQMLSGDVLEGDEAYEFTWVGKKAAMVEANKPTRQTLRPCPEESKNWDTTENLYIEGDNLQVLKLLQESYLGKVKMIYIDPPYNTGHDFIYNDHFEMDRDEYEQQTSMFDEDGNRNFTENTDANPRFHSDWCSMMYSRLMLARNLLTEDGVIFISIDDAEMPNLEKMASDVLGESNFVACLVYDKNRKNDAKYFSVGHEYILVYFKNAGFIKEHNIVFRIDKEGIEEVKAAFLKLRQMYNDDWDKVNSELKKLYASWPNGDERRSLARFSKVDEKGPYRDDGNINWPGGGGPMYDVIHPITKKPCKKPTSGWRYPTLKRLQEEIDNGHVVFGKDETTVPRVRLNLFEQDKEVMRSVHFSYAQTATNEFVKLFDGKRVFDNPKSITDISQLVKYTTGSDDIVLDFFSGSATTAHAVMQLNAEDGGHRKFIMVQLPEACDEKSEAYKAGYKTICDIGKERIRRAGAKIQKSLQENGGNIRHLAQNQNPPTSTYTSPDGQMQFDVPTIPPRWSKADESDDNQKMADALDTGFRVFKLDDSNMRDVYFAPDDYTQDMLSMMESNIKPDRTALDLLFGCLLEWGLPLSMPYRSETIDGCTVHTYNDGDLIACFDEKIPATVIEAIARRKPLRAVFRDAGFTTSPEKINLTEIFKLLAPDTRVKVI